MSKSTALTVQQRARQAIAIAQTEDQLKALAASTKDITKITNADGREQVHRAMMVLKDIRCNITNSGKEARDEAVKFSKEVIVQEKSLIGLISPEEERLAALRDEWDDAIEAEKQAKIDAELKRVTDLQARVVELRGNQKLTSLESSALLAEHISDLENIPVDATFEEFQQQAVDAKALGLGRLRELHTAAVAREAEDARIKAERAELEAFRAAQALRDQAERDRIAEEERKAKAARDADIARQEAALKVQREQQEADAAAERARIAKEEADAKAIRDAEAKKLAEDRAAFEREKAEADRVRQQEEREAAERARIANIEKPADAELIAIIAAHYRVPDSKVVQWLFAMNITAQAAA